MTVRERADEAARWVVNEVCLLRRDGTVPDYAHRWTGTWRIVEEASREFLEGLKRFEEGTLEGTALKRLGDRVILAWREAGEAAKEAWRKRQQEEEENA